MIAAVALAGTLALAACQPSASIASPVVAAQSGLSQAQLTVSGHGRTRRFTVEVATTPADQERGLMFRQHLAPDRGMIFPFPRPMVATFWMKDTLIPLDLVFIRADGTIANIAANARPMDLSIISSEGPVSTVLEIAGGRAAELRIQAGDRARWTTPR